MRYYISALLVLTISLMTACNNDAADKKADETTAAGDSSIKLPEGFTAQVFMDGLEKARHIVVDNNGVVFVKLDKLFHESGIAVLSDTNKDGRADSPLITFGHYTGTGITIKDGYLYASSNSEVYRYKLGQNGGHDSVQRIITGLVDKNGEHNSKSIVLDNAGNIYVNIGAPSNACQEQNRVTGSKGMNPCPILDSAGGIWQFNADKTDQTYKDGVRYATGIRNIVGLDWNSQVNELYAVQHGRDDLDRLYPDLYTTEQRVELPAEEMFKITKGSDFGWPYCYYDPAQKLKVQAPEYGGDGKKTGGCENKGQPIYAFPAHWAPNGMVFYTGDQFPAKYKNGAFIAFHGSWNRAPKEQAGYKVVFLPFKDGMPSGDYEVFADGFAGTKVSPEGASYRPCGLAQGPDGALYITDDQKGRIWKVTYKK